MDFVAGQRWVSHTEAQLGLGIVSSVADRLITVSFPAVEEERSYAAKSAPLSRVIYKVGDEIATQDGKQLIIEEILENNGLLIYFASDTAGESHIVPELQLDCFVQFTSPLQRLFSSQLDSGDVFQLRVKTLHQKHRLQQSGVTGLLGSRTSLLAHQVYIANEVAQRYAPRVLLADEVGLGKTIEAGMVIHQQLQTGRASRVILVLPPSLVHQWLVEMRRRFNLNFSIFNEARLGEDDEDDLFGGDPLDIVVPDVNPFESEQLILCSLDFLAQSELRQQQVRDAGFDLLVVDEAHHLEWSPEQASDEYQCIQELASVIPGVLLLTATPEQLGIESHFARLRLLDPSRFHDLEAFRKEEAGYQALNEVVQPLLALPADTELSAEQLAPLKSYINIDADQPAPSVSGLIRQLLDQHGTGRVLFRNTRAAIPDFPVREVHGYPLPAPSIYGVEDLQGVGGLTPEAQFDELIWLSSDPRVKWLEEKLKALRPAKALVICAHADTAVALEGYLQLRAGIRSAAFYEGLSVVERDRAAAYFTDEENGAQVLVCSEIGSEGRNFQFAQHLILFDLPLNPDLREQRIGRLDRIGQKNTIQIHVPYLEDSAQAVLFQWYQEGLNQFTQSCAVGKAIYEEFETELLEQLEQADDALPDLIADTASHTNKMREMLEQGRDRLLEINSCNKTVAAELIAKVEEVEAPEILDVYLDQFFDCFNIDQEFHSQHALILRPTEQMVSEVFPGLSDGDMTVTTDREFALSREDIEFLSWEHPLIENAIDSIISGDLGNATVGTLPVKGLQPGSLLLEVIYTTRCIAPKSLQLESSLPLSPMRLLLTAKGNDYADKISHEIINERYERVKKATAQAGIAAIRADIEAIVEKADALAQARLPALIEAATKTNRDRLESEASRLRALQKVNPAIRDEEIAYFTDQITQAEEHLSRATLEIQAVRVLITT